MTNGSHFCEGSYNKEVATSIIGILNKEKLVTQLIFSSEIFETQKEKIRKLVNRLSEIEITENGTIIRKQ